MRSTKRTDNKRGGRGMEVEVQKGEKDGRIEERWEIEVIDGEE